MTSHERTASSPRRGRLFGLARAAWFLIVTLAVGLALFSLPAQLAHRQILCSGSACPFDQISPNDLHQLAAAGVSLHGYAVYSVAVSSFFMLVFLVVATLLFARRSDDGMAIFTSLMLVTFGVSFNNPLDVLGMNYPLLLLPAQLVELFGSAAISIFVLVFPDGRFVPRWTMLLVPLITLREALRIFAPALLGADDEFFFLLVFLLGIQVYRYIRVSNTLQRQQTKWAVAGMSVGIGGFIALLLVGTRVFGGRPPGVGNLVTETSLYLFLALLPLSIGMAILRSHLWDIDLIIRRTLVFGTLTALLGLVYFGCILALQEVFRVLTGQSSDAAIVISTLAIAALFAPLRGRVQQTIDQHFYRRRYDARRVLAQFAQTARDETDLKELTDELIRVVDETMQPARVTVWLSSPGREDK